MPSINGRIVGTCGNCGGPVTMPEMWLSLNKSGPRCERCGARACEGFGPPVPMRAPPPRRNDPPARYGN